MWQAPAAAWSPPPQEEREVAGAARRAELRDFIAIRRALLRGGAGSKVRWRRQYASLKSWFRSTQAC